MMGQDAEDRGEMKLRRLESWVETLRYVEDQEACSVGGAEFYCAKTVDDGWAVALRQHEYAVKCKDALMAPTRPDCYLQDYANA